ncbi:MAG TPA: adenylate kinase [Bellilinea sp.]|uniref:Adenylate kinase n=2 Tax=environmental samples TaxID=58229 RepID=A0A0H4T9L6_9CHLR|nr:adk, adenylate kinase, adenylate kinase [uncultured Chloroflexi bacterium Rifle_16ft_4_minimus_640]AKQ05213.1 adk, adenylate kinase, adenylate kinase [uncultured Chloroflexi bacterium Rifle_16ft_4_minimus_24332]
MGKYIVLLGPPGAGKGTQAEVLSEKTGLAHISSGDIFRENLKAQSELGKLAQGFMNRGELVPDDVTIAMIRERLSRPDCAAGAILDGFPRTPAQAQALSDMLAQLDGKVVSVPYISVPAAVLVERLSGRWTCRAQGHIYHSLFNPPLKDGICDEDGSELYQREDDQPATVERRIRVYLEQTSPLIDHYRQTGLLVEVDGTQSIDHVTSALLAAVA